MSYITDFILVQCQLQDPSALREASVTFCAHSPVPVQIHRMGWVAETKLAYVYARLVTRSVLDDGVLPLFMQAWRDGCPLASDVQVSRLEQVFATPGCAAADVPAFHYVVETDPESGWMPEIARWYDTEHMPGLAAVPGCVHAMRLLNRDQGPLSLACYDLVSALSLTSPEWLAVRGTAWSDIARPHFTNTKRTVFEVVA